MAKGKGKFENAVASFNFTTKKVVSGTKVSANLYPTLNIGTVKDKFVADSKCKSLMDIGTGKRVIMIDTQAPAEYSVKIADDIVQKEARFLITPGYTKAGKELGAILGKNNEYSYGVIWGAIILNKDEVTEISPKDLEGLGIVIRRDTEKGKTSTSLTKISYTVAAVVDADGAQQFATIDQEEDGTEINTPIFALVDRVSEEHTPKSDGTEEEEGATEEAAS
jgi:hypothetical protein